MLNAASRHPQGTAELTFWVCSSKKILITMLKYSIHFTNLREDSIHSLNYCLLTHSSFSLCQQTLIKPLTWTHVPGSCIQWQQRKSPRPCVEYVLHIADTSGPRVSLPPAWVQRGCNTVIWPSQHPTAVSSHSPRSKWVSYPAFPSSDWTILGLWLLECRI